MFLQILFKIFRYFLRAFVLALVFLLYAGVAFRFLIFIGSTFIANESANVEESEPSDWRLELIDGRLEPLEDRILELIDEIDEDLSAEFDPPCEAEPELEKGLMEPDLIAWQTTESNGTKFTLMIAEEFKNKPNFDGTKSKFLRRKPEELLQFFPKLELELMFDEELKTQAELDRKKAEEERAIDLARTESKFPRINYSEWEIVYPDEDNELWDGEELKIRTGSYSTVGYRFVLVKDEHGLEEELNNYQELTKKRPSCSSRTKSELTEGEKSEADGSFETEFKMEDENSFGTESELIDEEELETERAESELIFGDENIKKEPDSLERELIPSKTPVIDRVESELMSEQMSEIADRSKSEK